MLDSRLAQQSGDAETGELIHPACEPMLPRSKAMFVPADPSPLAFGNVG
jgi:hypothetical protein